MREGHQKAGRISLGSTWAPLPPSPSIYCTSAAAGSSRRRVAAVWGHSQARHPCLPNSSRLSTQPTPMKRLEIRPGQKVVACRAIGSRVPVRLLLLPLITARPVALLQASPVRAWPPQALHASVAVVWGPRQPSPTRGSGARQGSGSGSWASEVAAGPMHCPATS